MPKKTSQRIRHIPQRTCVGCRQVLAKKTLIRLVRTSEGIRIDPTGKLSGRGAYLHEERSCWENGLKGSLASALKTTLSDADRKTLQEFLDKIPAKP